MSGNGTERDELYMYRFPKTLNDQAKWFGLPIDELICVIPVIGWAVWINKPIFGFIIGGFIWLLIKKAKKGKGSRWLYNLIYWYLPSFIFKGIYKKTPDSCSRQWIK